MSWIRDTHVVVRLAFFAGLALPAALYMRGSRREPSAIAPSAHRRAAPTGSGEEAVGRAKPMTLDEFVERLAIPSRATRPDSLEAAAIDAAVEGDAAGGERAKAGPPPYSGGPASSVRQRASALLAARAGARRGALPNLRAPPAWSKAASSAGSGPQVPHSTSAEFRQGVRKLLEPKVAAAADLDLLAAAAGDPRLSDDVVDRIKRATEASRRLETEATRASRLTEDYNDARQRLEEIGAGGSGSRQAGSHFAELEEELAVLETTQQVLRREVIDALGPYARAEQAEGVRSDQVSPPVDPDSTEPGEVALRTALSQLGKPYRFGRAGPDSFDSSGLTKFAWQAAGVRLKHSSRAQARTQPSVSREDLLPGDLVFFGDPIHHVGLYAGKGMMVHAPAAGETVQLGSLTGDYAGAARPKPVE